MRPLVTLSFSAISCTCGLSARTGTTLGKRCGRAMVSLPGVRLVTLESDPIIATAIGSEPQKVLLPRRPSLRVSNSSGKLRYLWLVDLVAEIYTRARSCQIDGISLMAFT